MIDPAKLPEIIVYQWLIWGLWELCKVLLGPRIQGKRCADLSERETAKLDKMCDILDDVAKTMRKIYIQVSIMRGTHHDDAD